MSEKKFPNGVFVKVVNTTHGSITKISIKKKEFIEYLNGLEDDSLYLNLDILKRPKPTDKLTHYVVVDEWKKSNKEDVKSDNPFDSF
jgi:hypothetical protein